MIPSTHIDPITAQLGMLAATFEDIQGSRIRAVQRLTAAYGEDDYSDHPMAAGLIFTEQTMGKELQRTLKAHPLWPWLEDKRGLKGSRTARIIARIGDPRKFPGQTCSADPRHYWPPAQIIEAGLEVGDPCPYIVEDPDEDAPVVGCVGTLQPPRPSTGVRSIWHYAGLHVVDGKLPRRTKGQQASWDPKLRTLLVGPEGTGDQIVKHGLVKGEVVLPYRAKYDEVKERKLGEEYPRWRADKIAKTAAAKEFLGDLLVQWKTLADRASEIEQSTGRSDQRV